MVYSTGYFYEKGREVTYISKKINKKTVEIPTVKKLNKGEYAVAYTKFKKYTGEIYPENESILWVDYGAYKVFEKRKKLHKITGYIPVGDNEFIAIQKRRILPLIILPILLLGLILCFVLIDANNNPDSPIDTIIEQWFPDIDENIGNKGEAEEKREIGQIYYNCFSKWHIKAGQTEDIAVPLTNDKKNNCYLTFEISLEDTGEVLYKSKQVPPDTGIYQIDISRPLEKGEYTCKIHITSNELKTGASMNSYDMMVDLIVD